MWATNKKNIQNIQMAPSILSANFMNLGKDVQEIAKAGADYIHVDVMDGHFVPNLTLGVPFVKDLKNVTNVPLDVHLMISNPAEQVAWYLSSGADIVTIHIEACESVDECRNILASIKEAGALCGISLNPETPASTIKGVLDIADLVLIMSVHPGFGGQSFISETLDKIPAIFDMCEQLGISKDSHPVIEIDGGINIETIGKAARAGAQIMVAGSAIFADKHKTSARAMTDLRQAAMRELLKHSHENS